MHAEEIRAHLRRQPFEPIRVHLTDGASYEVRHPENAAVTRRYLFIALPESTNGDEVPDLSVFCDPLHVTRIEPLNGRRKKATKKKKRS